MSVWPQCTMLYDGSFTGFLSCIAESFRRKEYPVCFIRAHEEKCLPYPLREVGADPQLARMVYNSLQERVSAEFQALVTDAFFTDLSGRERHIFNVAYLGLWRERPPEPFDAEARLLRRAVQKMRKRQKNEKEILFPSV